MKILALSDLHLDIYPAARAGEFISGLDMTADVVILAGDICSADMIPDVMLMFCSLFRNVVYVHGNHEFYKSSREEVLAQTAVAVAANKNLHWLDCNAVELDGRRFLGTPLWFKRDATAPKWAMNDFAMIRKYEAWVYQENQRARDFLQEELRAGDIVATHHLPSPKSIAKRYIGDPLNCFFVCDVGNLIVAREPSLWIHGHTHVACDYALGGTRVVCTPRGYPHEQPKPYRGTVIEI